MASVSCHRTLQPSTFRKGDNGTPHSLTARIGNRVGRGEMTERDNGSPRTLKRQDRTDSPPDTTSSRSEAVEIPQPQTNHRRWGEVVHCCVRTSVDRAGTVTAKGLHITTTETAQGVLFRPCGAVQLRSCGFAHKGRINTLHKEREDISQC